MKLPSSRRVALIAIGALFALYVLTVAGYHAAYAGRIFPGVRLGESSVANLTKDQLLTQSQAARNALAKEEKPLKLQGPNNETVNFPINAFVQIDGERLWTQAYQLGHDFSRPWAYAPFLLTLRAPSVSIGEAIRIDDTKLRTSLEQTVKKTTWVQDKADASLQFTNDPATPSRLIASVSPSRVGRSLDIRSSSEHVAEAIRTKTSGTVALVFSNNVAPTITEDLLRPLLPEAQRWVDGPLTLTANKASATIPASSIAKLIDVSTSSTPARLILNEARAQELFASLPLTQQKPPQDGTLRLNPDGTIAEITPPTRGQTLDISETFANLTTSLEQETRTASATVTTAYGHFNGPDADRLGIHDFLGMGQSNFSGSPTNRRKNIALGAKKVDASLIPTSTEFSLLHTLGTIDAASGWLPELVIKGNKTEPELGGGLCQIGSTVFRAALASGLPITQRQNHSYRVRYYEPAGTDATIYDPAPDFRFKNDTPGTILVTKEIQGDTVRFYMWGTHDGRIASSTTPVLSNPIEPPPKKIIETLALPPGTTKCTETAHAGVTAVFDYSVTYADGQAKKTTFRSVYKPWQAVCLQGVSQLSTSTTPTVDQTGLNNPG
ncbi:VanW family protein [Patescibacteria group bacterium]|nr:VanW family protein [Patescibacteria group bacterium]